MFKIFFVAAFIVCVFAEPEHHHHGGNEHHHGGIEHHHGGSDHHHGGSEHHHGGSEHHHGESEHHHGEDHHAETKLWKSDLRHDGWDSEFETTNHIRQAAHGDEHGNIHGDFEWVDPHGEHIAVKYVADEHGYHPESEALPTPHPIPEAILKAIDYIKAHPSHEEEHGHEHEHEHHHHH